MGGFVSHIKGLRGGAGNFGYSPELYCKDIFHNSDCNVTALTSL